MCFIYSEDNSEVKKSLYDVRKLMFTESYEIIKNICDLVNVVSWLPEGFLWAGKLSRRTNGLMGTISSIVVLNTVIQGHIKAKSTP